MSDTYFDGEAHFASVLDDPCAHDWARVWDVLSSEVYAVVDPTTGHAVGRARQLTGPPLRWWLFRAADGAVRCVDEDSVSDTPLCVLREEGVA